MNNFAIANTAIITERDFKNEYLFRMSSVATNPVTSIEFKPIRCATKLCHFGRTRNVYATTNFILLRSTAESSATSGYVVVLERFGQNEEPASRNEEQAKKKPSFVPISGLIRCNMKTHVNMNFIHHLYIFNFMYFVYNWCIF